MVCRARDVTFACGDMHNVCMVRQFSCIFHRDVKITLKIESNFRTLDTNKNDQYHLTKYGKSPHLVHFHS